MFPDSLGEEQHCWDKTEDDDAVTLPPLPKQTEIYSSYYETEKQMRRDSISLRAQKILILFNVNRSPVSMQRQ